MLEFFAAIFVFLAAHVLPAATGLRARLITWLGRGIYIALYSLVSLATIAWVIVAALGAPHIALWAPGPLTAAVPLVAMLPACLLFAGAALRPNPLSVSFAGGLGDPKAPGLLALTRHPILWAFFLWAASHLIANGDLVSLILFGSFALFSLLGMKRLEGRARTRLSQAEFDAATTVATGPLAARAGRAVSLRCFFELLAGVLLYGLFVYFHELVIGVDPLGAL